MHIDKKEINLYTNRGILKIINETVGGMPLLSIYFNSKLEVIAKTTENGTIVYYNSDKDLTVYLNNEINYKDLEDVAIFINAKNDKADFQSDSVIENLIDFISFDKDDKKIFLNYFNMGVPFNNVCNEMSVSTSIGELLVKRNSKDFPNGLMVYLNNSPIVLLEEHNETNNIVLKKYNNSKLIQMDSYVNLDPYDMDELDEKTMLEILSDIVE